MIKWASDRRPPVLQEEGAQLFRSHAARWRRLLGHAGVDVGGNLELVRPVRVTIFYHLIVDPVTFHILSVKIALELALSDLVACGSEAANDRVHARRMKWR
ncbi:hypothetical protein EVAR_90807_1 [Eumeta japonica]|uniref:Uncharacterized protein n=1 Tax=Eumeta variegata TaxID=151549 RepID=A0A4C2A947_EUMVA|nr:hypothetical protein EVAR_90807_1 [Eumeta japonica]